MSIQTNERLVRDLRAELAKIRDTALLANAIGARAEEQSILLEFNPVELQRLIDFLHGLK